MNKLQQNHKNMNYKVDISDTKEALDMFESGHALWAQPPSSRTLFAKNVPRKVRFNMEQPLCNVDENCSRSVSSLLGRTLPRKLAQPSELTKAYDPPQAHKDVGDVPIK